MKKIAVLIVGAACLICLLSVIGVYMFTKKNDIEEADSVVSENESSVSTNPSMYLMANCKLYEIAGDKNGLKEISFKNNTRINCFNKKILKNEYEFVRPVYDDVISDDISLSSRYLLDTKKKEINEVKYNTDNPSAAVYNSVNGKLYTYIVTDGIYEGIPTNPLSRKIMDYPTIIYGRGSAYTDDFSLSLSPGKDKLMLVDTFSSEVEGSSSNYKQILIINLRGDVNYSIKGSFARWIDQAHVVYLNISDESLYKEKVVVEEIGTELKTVLPVEGRVYHMDVNPEAGLLLVAYFDGTEGFEVEQLKTAVFDLDGYRLLDTLEGTFAYAYALDKNNLIAKTTRNCVRFIDEVAEFGCPLDGELGFYETEIVLYDLRTSEKKQLLTYNKPDLAIWID